MKALTKNLNQDRKTLRAEDASKKQNCSEEEVANTIIDSFNDQVYLNNQFKLRVKNMIASMEYAYPNDALKLQKVIDLFLGSSHKLMGDSMKKILDASLLFAPEEPVKIKNKFIHTSEVEKTKQNNHWMQDWMDQRNYFKSNSDIFNSPESDWMCFCSYVDLMDA